MNWLYYTIISIGLISLDFTSISQVWQAKFFIVLLFSLVILFNRENRSISAFLYEISRFLTVYGSITIVVGVAQEINIWKQLLLWLIYTIPAIVTVVLFSVLTKFLKLGDSLYYGAFIFILFILLRPLATHEIQILVGGILYATSGSMHYYRKSKFREYFATLSFSFLLFIVFYIGNLILILTPIISFFLGITVACIQNIRLKTTLSSLLLIFWIILAFYIDPNYRVYFSFSKPKINIVNDQIGFINYENGEKINWSDFSGKVVVLDFWTNSCIICFEQFPKLEKLYLKYKDNPNIKIFAVNLPELHPRDSIYNSMVKKHIRGKNYDFPVLKADSSYNYFSDMFGFDGVPIILLIDNNMKITYMGALNTNSHIDVNNIYNMLDALLKKMDK
jgi:thiol-disulfide isomerase/thioredoxin